MGDCGKMGIETGGGGGVEILGIADAERRRVRTGPLGRAGMRNGAGGMFLFVWGEIC